MTYADVFTSLASSGAGAAASAGGAAASSAAAAGAGSSVGMAAAATANLSLRSSESHSANLSSKCRVVSYIYLIETFIFLFSLKNSKKTEHNTQMLGQLCGCSVCNCKLTLDEEKSNHAGLAQQNGFGPAFFHILLRLVKGTTKPNTYQRKE